MPTPKISVEILGDSSSLERAFSRSSRSAKGFGGDVERASRGALAASLSFRGIGRSLTFASAQFLGGAGIVFALKSTIEQAEESQRVLGQTANAVQRAGQSWQLYGKQVQSAALAQADVSGFDDERLLGTFSLLVRRTKDVTSALKLNALAANVARGRNISLEAATSLVLKASLGLAGSLRRVGIEAKNGASSVQLIALLQQKYANSAKAFGATAAGAQERFRVALGNTQEMIGGALLPTITAYLNKASVWLNNTDNQAKLQRDLAASVGGAAAAIKDTAAAVRTVTGAFGGLRNTLEVLVALKIAAVVYGWTAALAAMKITAGGAAARLALLATRLKALTAIGAITIAIEMQFTDNFDSFRDRVDRKMDSLREGLKKKLGPFGFLTDNPFDDRTFTGQSRQSPGPKVPTGSQQLATAAAESRAQKQKTFDAALAAQQASVVDSQTFAKKALALGQKVTLAVQAARLAIARGDSGAQNDLVAALRQQIDLDRKYEKVQEGLARRGVGDIKAHVATLSGLRSDEASALDEIASIQQARVDKLKQQAQDAKEKAKQAAQHAKEILQSRQFVALGLSATGDERVPAVAALKKQLSSVSSVIEGSFLDTNKTQSMLSRIRRVLSGGLGAVTQDVRAKIRDMIAALKDELGKADGPLTKFQVASTKKLTAGLGLSASEVKALRARLSQVGPGSTVPRVGVGAFGVPVAAGGSFNLSTTVMLDGREVGRSVTKHQQRTSLRNPKQRRGFAGSR